VIIRRRQRTHHRGRPVLSTPAGRAGELVSSPSDGREVGGWWPFRRDRYAENRSQLAADAQARGEQSFGAVGVEYKDNRQLGEGVRAGRLERSLRPDGAERLPCEDMPLGPAKPELAWLIQRSRPAHDRVTRSQTQSQQVWLLTRRTKLKIPISGRKCMWWLAARNDETGESGKVTRRFGRFPVPGVFRDWLSLAA
jgi:hypothetical protein